MSNPLNTIFKPVNRNTFKTLLETQTRPFPNNKINRIQARYNTVFSKIMDIFNKSNFYKDIFLLRMNQRTKFMKINNKIFGKKNELLEQGQYDNLAKKLGNRRTYQKYMNNKETPLFTYITNDPDQFENWSAIRIFEWWRNLRMSRIPKREWPILDSVKYLFINQFMRIMNSYLKYGVDKSDKLAFDELKKYLKLVDEFYTSGGQYQYLLNAHLAFCEWFSARFIGGLLFESGRNNDKRYVSSSIYINKKKDKQKIIEYFNKTLKDDNGILLIPLSFFQKESKFINTYTAPLIVFLGINYRTHYENMDFNELYSPYGQIYHDFDFHAEILINNYNKVYKNVKNNISDILLFEIRCKFLTLLSSIDHHNDEFKKLLWYILHEIPRTIFEDSNLFFNIDTLFIILNEPIVIRQNNKKNFIFTEYSNDSLYTLICACIVFFISNFLPLEYFKDLKITVESILFMKNESNISNKVIKISRKEKLLIEFEYDVKTKQLKLHSLSDYNLLKGILELQSKGVSLVQNPYCFESYLLSPNTIQACEILSQSVFFNNIFLPKMRERVAKNRKIMRLNTKFNKLLETNFRTKQSELRITTNSFNKYKERYDTPLFTYIYEDKDQFENWSAIRIFEWWRNLRMSGSGTQFSTFTQKIPKQKWPVFDAVKYLFINQILHILNSYRKYGISDSDKSHWAFDKLQKYLQLVDVFYKSGGQYQYLLDAHLEFCEWFSARFIGGLLFERSREHFVNSKKYNINNIKKQTQNISIPFLKNTFSESLKDTNYILIIPLSYFQKESKFINTYSAPILPFLGINQRTHDDLEMYNYSPKNQITHDFAHHSKLICSSYSLLYLNENYSDIMLFSHRCNFLTIISLINNENLKKLLWYILHEYYFFNETAINFFNFNILFQKLNEQTTYEKLLRAFNNREILTQSIYTLICACIIFFMFQSFSLNLISQISIEINGLITTVSLNNTQLVIFEINSISKQIKIIYLNKDINQKISSFYYNIAKVGWTIVDSQQNTQKQINMYKKQIGNLYTKMLELQQTKPN